MSKDTDYVSLVGRAYSISRAVPDRTLQGIAFRLVLADLLANEADDEDEEEDE